jgi:hypothetical protein
MAFRQQHRNRPSENGTAPCDSESRAMRSSSQVSNACADQSLRTNHEQPNVAQHVPNPSPYISRRTVPDESSNRRPCGGYEFRDRWTIVSPCADVDTHARGILPKRPFHGSKNSLRTNSHKAGASQQPARRVLAQLRY